MNELEKFQERARLNYEQLLKNPYTVSDYLRVTKLMSEGRCHVCEVPIEKISVEKGEIHVKYIFPCGHGHIIASLHETISIKEDLSLATIGLTEEGVQKVQTRISGKVPKSQFQEILVCRKLATFYKPWLVKFRQDVQDSPVDVEGSSIDGSQKECFQVTRLYPPNFWEDLNLNQRKDLEIEDTTLWVQFALERKMKFPLHERKKITLLIEAWPGILLHTFSSLSLANALKEADFKEVWIVGSTREMTFQLY